MGVIYFTQTSRTIVSCILFAISKKIFMNLLIAAQLFMLITSLLPLGVLQYTRHTTGNKIAIWKILLCVFLFELTATTYAFSSVFMGWVDLIVLFLIWILFYTTRSLLPEKVAIIAPLVFGLLLMEPLSMFITIANGHIVFHNGFSSLLDELTSGPNLFDRSLFKLIIFDLYRITLTVLPLVGLHYLMLSVEGDKCKKLQ